MEIFELTRALVDIESTTNREKNVGDYLFAHLSALTDGRNGQVERIPAEPDRDNIFACWGEPVVTLSTHMDTVPPFFGSHEDGEFIWAAATPRGSRFLINGEPTENHLALGSKGALRYEITTHGKLAHSAYPELGHSAIHALLEVLQDIRQIPLPCDSLLGRGTLNIGTIEGGRAPNVVADHAEAEIMFRTVGDPAKIREAVSSSVAGRAEAREVLHTPAIQLSKFDGLPTTIVAFTTDIPTFDGAWGQPFLIGPGSIHVAHTAEERISKRDLSDAVDIYARMATQLLTTGRSGT